MARTSDKVTRRAREGAPSARPDGRRRAPARRRERQTHLYDLVHGLNAIIWEADPASHRYTFVSPRAEQILGHPAARWLAAGDGVEFWTALVHPEERERVVRFSLGELSAGRDHEIKYRAVAADGRVVWLHEVVRRRRDAAGRLVKLCGLMVDITACKRSEEALTESEERYRELFENANDFVYTNDLKWNFTSVNKAGERIIGYTRDEIRG